MYAFDNGQRASQRHQAGGAPQGDPAIYGLPEGMSERAERYRRERVEVG